jgi:hypothetical protein
MDSVNIAVMPSLAVEPLMMTLRRICTVERIIDQPQDENEDDWSYHPVEHLDPQEQRDDRHMRQQRDAGPHADQCRKQGKEDRRAPEVEVHPLRGPKGFADAIGSGSSPTARAR